MNKKLTLSLLTITLLFTTAFLGCSPNKTTKPSNEVTTKIQDSSKNSTINDATTNTKTDNIPATSLQPSLFKYIITSISSDTKIQLNTPWEESPLLGFKATIEGKGGKAQEEGYSHIIIKDEKTNKFTKLTLENQENNKITAKDLEWIDESNMFVILGQPFGTVSKGGKIYKVNICNGDIFLYEDTTTLKEEFTAVHRLGDVFNFEKYIYDDDNFIKGHSVTGILELK